MQKNKILFIIPWIPYPMISGGHQALFNGIAAVKDDCDVTLVYEATDSPEYRKNVEEFKGKLPNVKLNPLLHPVKETPTLSTRIKRKIAAIAKRITDDSKNIPNSKDSMLEWWKTTVSPYNRQFIEHICQVCKQDKFDIVQVEMPWIIHSVFSLPNDVKKIYVHHELGFVRRELEMKQLEDRFDYADSIRKFADLNEIGQLNMYDAIITLSPIDSEKLYEKGVTKPSYSSFAIIDAEPIENTNIGDGKRLTFIGPEGHNPNFVGVTWFLENCWQRLKSKDPAITLDVIGRWSESRKQEYAAKYPGVRFLGFVDNLNEAIGGSTMIVPITVGSGIRMKILEASSKGIPFVSTTVGAEGIPVTDGKDCFLTDDPEEFVNDIIKLQDKQLRQQFVENAYQMVVSNYSLDALRRNRLEIYSKV